jgi:hypothetical protein
MDTGICGARTRPGLRGTLWGAVVLGGATNEIGMRMALGAQREQVLWLTLDDGLRRAALGLVLGLAGGVAAPQNDARSALRRATVRCERVRGRRDDSTGCG